MSLSAPPNQPPPLPQPAPPLTRRQRLMNELYHWADMPPLRLAVLALSIGVLVFLDPPLPVIAYALWLWASLSWAWRDRWASILALARRGGVVVGLVLLFAALSSAHVWIFPDVAVWPQDIWRAHLPGELSLMPLFEPSLLARSLLLLPLAPALALYYERVDPRTRLKEQRILTARDTEPKKPRATQDAPPTAQKDAPQKRAAKPRPKPTAKDAPREPAEQPAESPPAPTEQITIEGYLATDTDPVPARPAPATRQATQKQKAAPAPAKKIDWNDVAE